MNIDREISLKMKAPAVQDIGSAGFKVKKIPEWEMGARGIIKTKATDELAPTVESIIANDEE